jgi:hypothetical protein
MPLRGYVRKMGRRAQAGVGGQNPAKLPARARFHTVVVRVCTIVSTVAGYSKSNTRAGFKPALQYIMPFGDPQSKLVKTIKIVGRRRGVAPVKNAASQCAWSITIAHDWMN